MADGKSLGWRRGLGAGDIQARLRCIAASERWQDARSAGRRRSEEESSTLPGWWYKRTGISSRSGKLNPQRKIKEKNPCVKKVPTGEVADALGNTGRNRRTLTEIYVFRQKVSYMALRYSMRAPKSPDLV